MEELKKFEVEQIFIAGSNTEFWCMFTAIAAYDRGFHVTFLEEATGTVNQGEDYDISKLGIQILSELYYTGLEVMEVIDIKEYRDLVRSTSVCTKE